MSSNATLEVQFSLRAKPGPRQEHELSPMPVGLLPQITRVLALAIHIDDLLRKGEVRDYSDAARLGLLCRERVSQIMRLTYLAPDIQIEILYFPPVPGGRYPISETAMRRIASMLSWADQRTEWARLKATHRLS